MADIPGDPTTTAVVTVGSTTPGAIETIGDHDWYKVTLAYGQSITVTVTGSSSLNTYLNIYDPTGMSILASNDDIGTGGNTDSRLTFTPTAAGTYFIDVGASHNQSTGTYDLFVEPPSLNVWSYGEIANELTNYYWGGDVHHWNVAPGGTLTVNISGLTTAEQNLAVAALADWTDISGIKFQQVTTGGQITFSDAEDPTANGPVAQTNANWANGIITSANIEISKSWITNYGTGLDSYSFQTYIHEIGHALGLGHGGDYNLNASFTTDALYANDAWSTTVMSYFSPHDNYYFNNQGFSADYDMTPMVADVLAIQQLYGLSTTTRVGDTTYGYHSTADNPVYNAALYPDAAYTIYDSGGNDTLDYSGSSANQLINLNPETFSNVNGQTGNVMIAPGVVIENAIGGSGDDTIIQNSANNVLDGGAGNNTVSYETATAGVTVNLGLTTTQDTGGAGVDTLSGFQNLIGSAFADDLIAGPSTISISGGAGDDRIESGTANGSATLHMYGGDGNDTFVIGSSPVAIDGGAGFNIVDGSNATAALSLVTNGQASGSPDSAYNVQEIIGSSFADNLLATASGDVLIGGPGDDTLTSYFGGVQLVGGPGNDTYNVWTATDQIVENPGEGIDTVIARASYTLGPNLENLQLYEYETSDPYAGASLPPPNVQENWSAVGNDLSNVITGNAGDNVITGLGGADKLTGGGGNDTFLDTAANHNGDTITDFHPGDTIVFSDATLGAFSFSLLGNALTYSGGSMTVDGVVNGKFTATAAAAGGVQLTEVLTPAAHNDFNGDGHSDVLWRNDNGTVSEWLATSNGGFVAGAGSSVGLDWHIIGTGDFNGDGREDILWRNDNGQITEWLSQSDGSWVANSAATVSLSSNWQIAGTGDFNGDGHTDILWRDSTTGTVSEWLAQANGSFVSGAGANVGPNWHVAGTGDFNGDGKDDILWRNDDGTLTEWLGQANGSFVDNGANLKGVVSTDWQIVGTGDMNGDGLTDIMWRDTANNTVSEWLASSSGNGSFVAGAGSTVGPDWHVIGMGDYNGDAIDDVLWQNNNGSIVEWLGQSNGGWVSNAAHASGTLSTSWHVQDPFF